MKETILFRQKQIFLVFALVIFLFFLIHNNDTISGMAENGDPIPSVFYPDNRSFPDTAILDIPMTDVDTAVIVSPGLHTDDGKLAYYDQSGKKASALGLDVSFYNNSIDWNAVKESGIDFVIIRLGGRGWTSGLRYHDIKTQQYLRGAKKAGLRVGCYYYSTAKNPKEAQEEASDVISTLNGITLELPVYIDMEYSGDYPDGRADVLSPALRADIADAFCSQLESAGYSAGIYSSQSIFLYDYDIFSVAWLPVWLASYTVNDALPDYSGQYDVWQFTDSAHVIGIDGFVDMNVILNKA